MIFAGSFLTSLALLFLRIVVATVFYSSGKNHIEEPETRGESIGLASIETTVLGIVEIMAAISVALGIYIQIGSFLIVATMLGAIYKKIVIWKTGFYEEKGYGWHYDLLLLMAAFVIFTTAGGDYVII